MKRKKAESNISAYIYTIEEINERKIENKMIEANKYFDGYEVCSHFGCGKRLMLEEILAGGRCHEHTNKKRK